jgi:hypothetical protein
MTQRVTIELPDELYYQLKRTAELMGKPIASVVEQSVRYTVPPLVEDIPEAYQVDIFPLLDMDIHALKAEAAQTFPADKWARYEELLELKRDRPLTQEEDHELTQLRREADILSLRKAYATVLLKRQGYAIPIPSVAGSTL